MNIEHIVSDLEVFSGEDAECDKCGHEGAETHYQSSADITNMGSVLGPLLKGRDPRKVMSQLDVKRFPEHLARVCERCGFVWVELPVDTAPEEVIDP